MSNSTWPEIEVSTTTNTTSKAPEWSLRTESELHVERLEAKLESIKKRNDRTNNKSARHPHPETQLQILEEPDAEEIQVGQEEADEGLWLLWNNTQKTVLSPSEAGRRLTSTASQPLLSGSRSGGGGSASYGSDTRTRIPREDFDSDGETDSENEEEEDRLEQAKAQAKDVDEYLAKNRNRHCRTTCCIIS
ncbi:hypothetical protein BGZ47_000925 [Haplosporangium gracile]|nr:hypothetical protein BGZ47_000925 [Haplosporangium gracile]